MPPLFFCFDSQNIVKRLKCNVILNSKKPLKRSVKAVFGMVRDQGFEPWTP